MPPSPPGGSHATRRVLLPRRSLDAGPSRTHGARHRFRRHRFRRDHRPCAATSSAWRLGLRPHSYLSCPVSHVLHRPAWYGCAIGPSRLVRRQHRANRTRARLPAITRTATGPSTETRTTTTRGAVPARATAANVVRATGRARMSYRRAVETFTALTRPLDTDGRGWTLHQLSAAGRMRQASHAQ